jgi:hypothetical protein
MTDSKLGIKIICSLPIINWQLVWTNHKMTVILTWPIFAKCLFVTISTLPLAETIDIV